MTADKLSVRVNYILDAQNNGKFNFDTSILKKFENEIKTTKDIGKYFKNKKTACHFIFKQKNPLEQREI